MARTLRRGSQGTDVAQLQADLNRFLSPVPLLTVDGDFGRNTETAVRAFQRREGLTPDGIVGSRTHGSLQRNALNTGGGGMSYDAGGAGMSMPGTASPPAPAAGGGLHLGNGSTDSPAAGGGIATISTTGITSAVAELAAQIALTQTNVREVPKDSNDGEDIRKYARAANKRTPLWWCMVFVYWSFEEAANRLGRTNPMSTVPDHHKAYVTGVFAWARNSSKVVSEPVRGDIFCVQGGTGGRTHKHTGIVTSVTGGTVATIEGNTTDPDQSNTGGEDRSHNGGGVYARSRSTSRLDFIRLS